MICLMRLRGLIAIEDRPYRHACFFNSPRRLDIGGEQASIAVERAVKLDGETCAVVLHQNQFFLRIAARAFLASSALHRGLKQVERRAQSLQGRLEKIDAH